MKIKKKKIIQKLIPVVSLPDIESGIHLAKILVRNKIDMVEITFRTPYAAEGIAAINKQFPGLHIFAGTVLTTDQVKAAMAAGAQTIVSPGFDPALVTHCQALGLPVIPGICTPSEIQVALSMGVTRLKFFPAELSGGPQMVRMMLNAYPEISMMPTGGITLDNLLSYLSINRVFCCGSSWLAPMDMMLAREWANIEKRVKAAVNHLQKKIL